MITTDELETAIRLACEAIPGPWHWPSKTNGEYSVSKELDSVDGELIICTPNSNFEWCKPTAAHIAFNADPERVKRWASAIQEMKKAMTLDREYYENKPGKMLSLLDEFEAVLAKHFKDGDK